MIKLALLAVVLWVVFKLGRRKGGKKTGQDIGTKIMLAVAIVLLLLAVMTNIQN
ncbi:MAG: hypothetical protein ACOCVM_02265 [Desulfovibrionaceae bacterium]